MKGKNILINMRMNRVMSNPTFYLIRVQPEKYTKNRENMLHVRHDLLYDKVEQRHNKHAYKQYVCHKTTSCYEYDFYCFVF